MCNYKEKRYIHNTNRIAIACASLIAMLIDGVNTANCLYLVSAIVWLFLPECDAAEEHVLEALRAGKIRILGKKHTLGTRAAPSMEYTQLSMQKCEATALLKDRAQR